MSDIMLLMPHEVLMRFSTSVCRHMHATCTCTYRNVIVCAYYKLPTPIVLMIMQYASMTYSIIHNYGL